MGRSLGLACYLAISEHATRFAEKKVRQRQGQGKEFADRAAERRGQADIERPGGPLVWFHAANVTESLSVLELIRRLADMRPELQFLITTSTLNSAELLAARLPERSIHQFIPVDARPFVREFLNTWKPDLAVWTENRLWPALIFETAAAGVPMVLINVKISKLVHRRWRWVPGMAASLLKRFNYVLAQDEPTARYLTRLGLPRDRLEVTGPLKEGSAALPYNEAERAQFAKNLAGRPVWLAASTHDGEEEIAATAHRRASRAAQRLLLIIVPRYPERGAEIAERLRADGWEIAVRSQDELPEATTQIYLADTMGELGLWYRVAPVSFIGGSIAEVGGHNPFEPAALGSAIIHGPHVQKVADIYDRLATAGATVEVRNAAELEKAVGKVLNPDTAATMAHAAWEISSSGAEVTDRALNLLLKYLPQTNQEAA